MTDVDDLRARLRELGYLDAGVDRFVLGAAGGGRGLVAAAARTSLRIGLLAALLLGPSSAVALATRLPALVTGLRDAVVLTLYLSVLFGSAVALFALVVGVLLASVVPAGGANEATPGARGLARGAGLLFGAGCLVYLVFWWRAVNAGAVHLPLAWTLPALAWTAFTSVLLGRAVHLATLALLARGDEGAVGPLGSLRRRRATSAALGVAGFLGGAALLFLTTSGEPGNAPAAAERPQLSPTGVRITLVALDGVDLGLVERLRAEGRLPTLGKMLQGARVRLPASDAPDPARTWTSLATGMPPEVHGVGGIEARRVSGIGGRAAVRDSGLAGSIAAATDLLRLTRPAPTTGMERRVETFWEVAAEAGLSTLVVNWWASWPASGPAAVLSDRAILRLERGGALDAEVSPASLYARLRREWPRLREEAVARVAAAFPGDGETAAALRRAALQDVLNVTLASASASGPPDLEAIYLPGLDIAQYELLVRPGSGLPPSVLAARVEAVERYYAFLDGLLGPLLSGDARTFALVTDPGRSPLAASSGGRDETPRPGLLVLRGGAARAGEVALDGERGDVAPTLLYALGVPVSRELPGRPVAGLFDPAFLKAHPVRFVDGYGRRNVAPRQPGSDPLDQEMLDRLRSLGYVR